MATLKDVLSLSAEHVQACNGNIAEIERVLNQPIVIQIKTELGTEVIADIENIIQSKNGLILSGNLINIVRDTQK